MREEEEGHWERMKNGGDGVGKTERRNNREGVCVCVCVRERERE